MVAAVAGFLRRLDIILDRNDGHIILAFQHPADLVNIVHKRTYHTDTRYIIQVGLHRFDRKRKSAPLQFFYNTLRLLHSRLDHLDRVSCIPHGKLIVEHFQLRLKLSNRAAVLHHRFLKLPCRLPECLRNLKYLRRIDREMAQLAVRILSNIHLYSSTSSI